MSDRRVDVYLPLHMDTLKVQTLGRLSENSENLLMQGDHYQSGYHKRRDNDGDSLYRPKCKLTADDAGTVIGLCVSFLVMLTGALVYIVIFGLLMAQVQFWLHWWTR